MSFESGSLGDGFAAELVDKSLAIQYTINRCFCRPGPIRHVDAPG